MSRNPFPKTSIRDVPPVDLYSKEIISPSPPFDPPFATRVEEPAVELPVKNCRAAICAVDCRTVIDKHTVRRSWVPRVHSESEYRLAAMYAANRASVVYNRSIGGGRRVGPEKSDAAPCATNHTGVIDDRGGSCG
jgi:hypothetical protein